jgi:hypothetical protein
MNVFSTWDRYRWIIEKVSSSLLISSANDFSLHFKGLGFLLELKSILLKLVIRVLEN